MTFLIADREFEFRTLHNKDVRFPMKVFKKKKKAKNMYINK